MKKLFLLFTIVFLYITRVQADGIKTYIEDVSGPVKKVTVTSKQAGMMRNWVYWYDTAGRLIEEAYLRDGKPDDDCFVRQYMSNDSYADYFYNELGFIDGCYRLTQLDSLGNKTYSIRFKDGKLWTKDSIVYNEQGKGIECYSLKDSVLTLRYTYEYDSLGRLYARHFPRLGNKAMDKYEYLDNGNYIKYHYDKDGKKSYAKHIFNKQGIRVKVVESIAQQKLYFKKFDEHGNWTLWRHIFDSPMGQFDYTYERNIEYYAPEENDTVYLSAEQLPEFPGGQQLMFQYIVDNVKYPTEARIKGIQGRTVCQFVVNKSGELTDVKIVKSSGNIDLDNEAIRVICSMPKWKPGRSAGEIVRVKYTVPVTFKIATPDWQNDSIIVIDGDTTIKTIVEKMPEFPGGQQALFYYLSTTVTYPLIAQENGIQGTSVVQFVINQDGSISDVTILRSAGETSLDNEAMRVIRLMPNWSPGILKGKPVRVMYTIPVHFRITDLPNTPKKSN